MKSVFLFTIFITICKAMVSSLLTGTNNPNSTALINDRREIKEIDVLRQIINQETLIRLARVRDVKALVEDVTSVKRSIGSTKAIISSLQQAIETLKRQLGTLSQEQKREIQKIEQNIADIYELFNNRTLQTVEKAACKSNEKIEQFQTFLTEHRRLQREVDQLRQDNMEIRDLLTNLNLTRLKLNADCKDLKAIQKRISGSVTFSKTWKEFKKGFGNPHSSYWIGNDVIHHLTKERNSSLYVSITLQNGTTFYELYHQFSVSDEANKYKLFLGGPAIGTLGDSMLNTWSSTDNLFGMYFSTTDQDNDRASENCAANKKGGWWFNNCHDAFLNGPWSPQFWYEPWTPTVRNGYEIKETLMMIKPH
ncbi:angiopoietin-2-like [Saccostrea echinata]|uniref:angiopoietin-2-like n=1 Tax=Saccostrea echinata TaxID=191078 RepID=UPI002A81CBBF|nr:angiopoietin-2-like [Saccostrea echinata]